jgi:Metallo-beta-lactamase superfamily
MPSRVLERDLKNSIRDRPEEEPMTNRLQWDVFISSQIPAITNDLPPGASEMKWSPISSTLISGKRDAVLVDTAITVEQNQKIAAWIAASGKNLTTIYATHGHGDHFFGVNTIRKGFPNAQFVATREVIAVMQKQASAPVVSAYWKARFPGQIDSTLVIADELKEGVIELEQIVVGNIYLISREPDQFRGVSFVACTCATNFCSKGDELSFFQMRLSGSRTFISSTGSKTMSRGQCQRMDSVIQAIPIRCWTRLNTVSRSLAS